jgi:hypothetical protein
MTCRNCGKKVDIETWILKDDSKRVFETIASIATGRKAYCSETCMLTKQAKDHEERQKQRR